MHTSTASSPDKMCITPNRDRDQPLLTDRAIERATRRRLADFRSAIIKDDKRRDLTKPGSWCFKLCSPSRRGYALLIDN